MPAIIETPAATDVTPVAKQAPVRFPWYWASYGDNLTEEGKEIFESCGIPRAEQEAHILRVRDEAWEVFPFPCIGQFWFIEFVISHHPRFPDVISLLRSAPQPPAESAAINGSSTDLISYVKANKSFRRHLDVGTCMGQDVRALRHYGVPPATLHGTDLQADFEPIGQNLFKDRETFANRFFQADMLADEDPINHPIDSTFGHWDVITATMLLHLFDLPAQKVVAGRLVRLLRPEKGCMLLGSNTGQLEAERKRLQPPLCKEGEERYVYRQSRESLEELLTEAVEKYGGGKDKWKITCTYDLEQLEKRDRQRNAKGADVRYFDGPDQRCIWYTVERL